MATSGASVKLRRLRQRFGINAPRLAIRTHVPWYWRALFIIAVASISMASAAWIYDAGRRFTGQTTSYGYGATEEIRSLRGHVMELDAELTKLRSQAGSGESSLQMERATQRQLANQVKVLEAENAALREDLAFFEGLMPGAEGADETGVRIDRFRVEPTGMTGEFRYRLLVVNNAGRQTKDLRGNLQLLVKVRRDGGDAIITMPALGEKDVSRFRFEVKHFHRMEGTFNLPEDASVLGVEARLLQDGAVRATQTLTL